MRRYLQISLRTLLLMMGFLGCLLGWLVHERNEVQLRCQAAKAIRELHGWGDFDEAKSRCSVFARVILGDDGSGNVTALDLWRSQVTSTDLIHLQRFKKLRQLDVGEIQITDAGLVQLGRLSRLELLALEDTSVTDDGLQKLRGLTQLQELYLERTPVTRNGVETLKKSLPNVKIFWDGNPRP